MATTATTKTGPFEFDPARCDEMSEVLAQRWWAVGLRGILAIIFGLLCLLTPGTPRKRNDVGLTACIDAGSMPASSSSAAAVGAFNLG